MNKKTVLIVNDEVGVRAFFKIMLTKYIESIEIHTAENGLEALDKLKVISPDLIITDCFMPEMNGEVLYQHIRQVPDYNKLPIIFHRILNQTALSY